MGNSKALESSKSFYGACYHRSSWKCITQFQEIYGTNWNRVRDPFCIKNYIIRDSQDFEERIRVLSGNRTRNL